MTFTEELDNSWIEQFKEEDSEYNNFYKEKPTSVKLCFMYINKEKEVEFIKKETILLNNNSDIEKNDLISLIKKMKPIITSNINYYLS